MLFGVYLYINNSVGISEACQNDIVQGGVSALNRAVGSKNTDLLKAETAHHNPGNLNPDGVLNEILDEYFRFVKRIRR